MPNTKANPLHPILHLRYQERDGTLVVEPEDEDRFTITVEAAIKACRVFLEQARMFQSQFNHLHKRLATWLKQHNENVNRAYLTVRDADLLFLVVRDSRRYDDEFEDALTELDVSIACDPELDLIKLSVLAVPSASLDSIDSFLAPGKTLTYQNA
jgi:hypothetical protein